MNGVKQKKRRKGGGKTVVSECAFSGRAFLLQRSVNRDGSLHYSAAVKLRLPAVLVNEVSSATGASLQRIGVSRCIHIQTIRVSLPSR
jgi:hypothetical protein